MVTTDQQAAVVKSSHPADKVNTTTTMYDVSGWEIFWRNFLAGASRTLGSLVLYILFFAVVVNLFVNIVLPKIQPFLDGYMKAIDTLDAFSGPSGIDAPAYGTLFDQAELDAAVKKLQQQ